MSSWLQAFIGNMIAAEQLDELHQLNEKGGPQRREFDWENQTFKDEMHKTIKAFFESHGIQKGHADLRKQFPEKVKAKWALDDMANEGRINELEYLLLYKQILAPASTESITA